MNIRIGQTIGNAQRMPQLGIDTRDHVLHYLNGRVPDAQILSEFRIECRRLKPVVIVVLAGLEE
jgi:hypothetical protein